MANKTKTGKPKLSSKNDIPYFISLHSTMMKSIRYTGQRKVIKYMENNQELYKEQPGAAHSKKSISEVEFKELVRMKVESYLNTRVDQIVLLVGAGGSVVPKDKDSDKINDEYGLPMVKILEEIKTSLDDCKYLSFDEMVKLAYRDDADSAPVGDLESLLSKFERSEEFIEKENNQKSKFHNTLNKIRAVIKDKTSYGFQENCMKHLTLINLCNKKVTDGNKLSIVTTNYDTVLEEAAAAGKYTVFDGFSFGDVPYFDAKMFDWNLVKDVPNFDTREMIYDKKVINLLKIHGSLTWVHSESGSILRVPKKGNEEPVMIFPSSNKYEQSYRAPYSDLFYKFRELLNRPRTLLITVGFSFDDTHIFEMVNDAIRHNDGLSVLFTNYSIAAKEKTNLEQLQQRMNEGYQIAFLKATLNADLTEYLK